MGIDTVRNHHGQPAHQGLDNHRTEVFGVRRQNKQFCVHKSGQFQLVTYDPRKYNPIRHTELCRHLPHLRFVAPKIGAHDHEPKVRVSVCETLEGGQQKVESLLLTQSSDEQQERPCHRGERGAECAS